MLLRPTGPGGDRRIVRAVYDVHAERPVTRPVECAPSPAVLVLDGIFLHRPELREYWDFSVFLEVDFATSIPGGRGGATATPTRRPPATTAMSKASGCTCAPASPAGTPAW